MKKPNRKPRQIPETSNLIECSNYTPELLRSIADKMDENKISHLSLNIERYDGYLECIQYRLETQKEADKRYLQESKQYIKFKKQQKLNRDEYIKKLKAKAKAFGLKVTE